MKTKYRLPLCRILIYLITYHFNKKIFNLTLAETYASNSYILCKIYYEISTELNIETSVYV